MSGPYIEYVKELKESGRIRHIGMSTHNPAMAKRVVESGIVEMLMFSVNPAFDLLPPTDNIDNYFADEYQAGLNGIDPVRTELYKLCERHDVGLTVMKPYAGGRLFDAERSPFGVALTPVQCIHYCLTRPAVAAVWQGMTPRNTWNRLWPTRPPVTGRKTMPLCWPALPSTLSAMGSVPIAATANPAPRTSTLPW